VVKCHSHDSSTLGFNHQMVVFDLSFNTHTSFQKAYDIRKRIFTLQSQQIFFGSLAEFIKH